MNFIDRIEYSDDLKNMVKQLFDMATAGEIIKSSDISYIASHEHSHIAIDEDGEVIGYGSSECHAMLCALSETINRSIKREKKDYKLLRSLHDSFRDLNNRFKYRGPDEC